MINVNHKFAHYLLFESPETGEALYPESEIENDEANSCFYLTVRSKDGKERWKHTIKTEEL